MQRTLRQVAGKYPFLRKLYHSLCYRFSQGDRYKLIRQLSGSSDARARQIAGALKALNATEAYKGDKWPRRIEAIRSELLASDQPLVDGTFGAPGIYDGGDKTVKGCCAVSKPPRAAFFLYCLTKSLKSKKVLELGTNVGISSAYLAAGMKNNEEPGRLVTCESSPYRQRIAKQVHEKLGLDNIGYVLGLFSDTLDSTLKECVELDLAFIDGHHKYQPTLDYLNAIIPYAAPGSVFMFDDISWSDGMRKAWNEIRADERFRTVVDLESVGLCVLGSSASKTRSVYGPVHIL